MLDTHFPVSTILNPLSAQPRRGWHLLQGSDLEFYTALREFMSSIHSNIRAKHDSRTDINVAMECSKLEIANELLNQLRNLAF